MLWWTFRRWLKQRLCRHDWEDHYVRGSVCPRCGDFSYLPAAVMNKRFKRRFGL